MSDSAFGDRSPKKTFDPEQSNGEDAPANNGTLPHSPANDIHEGVEVKREFGREIKD